MPLHLTLKEIAMRDLFDRLRAALREIATAPLDWSGPMMLALMVAAVLLFMLAMVVLGGASRG